MNVQYSTCLFQRTDPESEKDSGLLEITSGNLPSHMAAIVTFALASDGKPGMRLFRVE